MINKKNIKKILKEIIIGITILFIVSNIISYIRQPKLSSDSIPNITLKTIENKSINLANYQGKPLLIHFWATWCPTCKLETSNIDIVSKKYQIITIAVNSKNDEHIKNFMRQKDATFDVIHDKDGSFASQFAVEVFPTTFIYNSKGKLLFSEVGYTSTAGLLARMAWATNR